MNHHSLTKDMSKGQGGGGGESVLISAWRELEGCTDQGRTKTMLWIKANPKMNKHELKINFGIDVEVCVAIQMFDHSHSGVCFFLN